MKHLHYGLKYVVQVWKNKERLFEQAHSGKYKGRWQPKFEIISHRAIAWSLKNVLIGPILSFCASKTELVYSTASHGSLEIYVVKPYLKQIAILKDPFA